MSEEPPQPRELNAVPSQAAPSPGANTGDSASGLHKTAWEGRRPNSHGESPQQAADDRLPFSRLYQATIAPLRRHLARILGNHAEAQDVAHDAYLKVYPIVERQEAGKPEALLYTTARRLAFNRLKRRRIAPFATAPAEDDVSPSPAPGVAEQVMARQEWQHLEQAIAELPAGCRSVLLLRKLELLSHQEIADRLGIAVSTVEKQHARALRLLRAALTVPGETAPTDPAPRP